MTGFARVEGAAGAWAWSVEARSVNGRNLEVRFRGPPGFDALERVAREAAQARFQRGQLNLGVQARRIETVGALRINRPVLDAYADLVAELVAAGRAALPSGDGLLRLPGVVEAGAEEATSEALAEAMAAMTASLEAALDGLKAARLEEGAALASVLAAAIDRIEALVAQAEREAAAQTAAIRDRFRRRMAELVDTADLQERILQEAAVLAGRADVREELDRLTAHVAAARALLAEGPGVGRRFDFLAQEFNREANTLCSKSATSALTAVGLELKAAVEQLREQIQNVE
jgi:uncharacterized protein (TIGR00255 family)